MLTYNSTMSHTGFIHEINPDIDQLMDVYRKLHFIYPAKMEKLSAVYDLVKKNWKNALRLHFPLFYSSIVRAEVKDMYATATIWQYLNNGLIGQHLASNHPVASREVLLGMLSEIISKQHVCKINSFQIFYRPQNKYPNRLFSTVSETAGNKLSQIIEYDYFEMPVITECSPDIKVVEVNESNKKDWLNFISTCRSRLFISGQEYDTDDIQLNRLNQQFRKASLERKRQILIAYNRVDHKVCGAIIKNNSSVGLNFSLLENCAEIILDKAVIDSLNLEIARSLIWKMAQLNGLPASAPFYALTDCAQQYLFEELGGKWVRNYNLFLILKGGYEIWYNCVEELTSSVYQRFEKLNQLT